MPAAARQATAADPATLLHLTQSIADVEYAIRTHEEFRKWFAKWLKFHIWISVALYVLIALHVWAAIYFGLRWFEPDAARHYRTAAAVAAPAVAAPAVAGPEDHVGPGRTAVDAGVARFSSHYAALFRRYWRPAVRVHDIRTTVFDYAGIASETRSPESDFSAAEMALRRVRVDGLRGDDAEKAFWINAYNFGAMSLAAKNYPIPSIVDSRISAANPWGVPAVWIGDKSYSLQQIENEILLRKFDDARIVFAISCAAVRCPDRSDEIFAADRIDRQLDAMVRGLLANSSKGLMIDRDRNLVTISWIFKADQRLFRGGQAGVLRFVIRYAPPDARAWLIEHAEDVSVRYFTHDWSLNDAALADTGTEG